MTALDMGHPADEFGTGDRSIAFPCAVAAGEEVGFTATLDLSQNTMNDEPSVTCENYDFSRQDFRDSGFFHGD